MDKKKKPPKSGEGSIDTLRKLMVSNKGLALSFAVALAVSNLGGGSASALADQDKKPLVLEKEKEGDEAEREWDTEKPESYGNYGTGYGYFYSPFHYLGAPLFMGRATWASPTSKKAVGGYSLFRGTSAG